MKKAIITGVTGTIGMALLQELTEQGMEVLAICREGSDRNAQIPHDPKIKCIECSMDRLENIMAEEYGRYDVCYHLAWMGTTGKSRNDMYLQNRNVRYALDAVEMAARLGCHTFIGAGSQAEYGHVQGKLTPETATNPVTGYGIAKLCAGQMTRERAHQLGMRHIWVRVLSIYGPYDGKQSMVMSGIYDLLAGKTPQYTKGEQQWDYLYSGDAARAFRMLGEKESEGVYCLGGGQVRPLKEYIELIRKNVDPRAKVTLGAIPYQENQVMYLCADISRLTAETGFVPETSFEEGIRKTIGWCREQCSL